jgi:uncharacterized protein YdaU (DUF1376 family)
MSRPNLWLPLYVGDYLRKTMRLTTEQHGAYLLLLMALWSDGGSLPADDETLAAVTRLSPEAWRRHAPTILPFFAVEDGLLVSPRLVEEQERAAAISKVRQEAGAAAAAKRWGADSKNSKPIAKPIANGVANGKQTAWVDDGSDHAQSEGTDPATPETAQENSKNSKPIANGVANPIANGKQNDAQSQSHISAVADATADADAGARDDPPKAKVSRSGKHPTMLPQGWTASETDRQYAAERGMSEKDIQRVEEHFRDYWQGRGDKHVDWAATWRRWVRTEQERGGQGLATAPRQPRGGGRVAATFADVVARRLGTSD